MSDCKETMQRTMTQESVRSQGTEAPLSEGEYDYLVRIGATDGINGPGLLDEDDVVKKEEISEPFNLPHEHNLCLNGNNQNFDYPQLTRSYSLERQNRVPPHPCRFDYPGLHNFSLIFDDTLTISKSMPWTFSTELRKVFCKIKTPVPIKFHMEGAVPPESFIRVILVCQDDDSAIIKTCARHVEEIRTSGGNIQFAHHMVQCTNQLVLYGICPETERYSIRFPVLPLQAGVSYQSESLMFNCFSSCLRREIEIIFTLESNHGVLGRQKVGIRVCACPGRDRIGLERKVKRSRKGDKHPLSSDSDSKRKKSEVDGKNEQKRCWMFAVHSKTRFKCLKRINKSLDLIAGAESRALPSGEAVVTRNGSELVFTMKEKIKQEEEGD